MSPVANESDGTDEPTPALDLYPNGKPRFRPHLDGEMHGEWTFYRADGSVMRTVCSIAACRSGGGPPSIDPARP